MESMSSQETQRKKRRKKRRVDHREDLERRKKKKNQLSSKKTNKKSSKKAHKNKKEVFKHGKTMGIVGDVLFYGIVLMIIFGSAFIYFGDKNANIMGYRIMTVLTNSMEQNEDSGYKNGFDQGSMIVIKNVDPDTLKKGDVITFNPVRGNEDVFLTHRVINIDNELKEERQAFITTKGDANKGADVPIASSQVVGKVVKAVPQAGYVLSFIKKNVVVVAILISTTFGIIGTLKYARTISD